MLELALTPLLRDEDVVERWVDTEGQHELEGTMTSGLLSNDHDYCTQ